MRLRARFILFALVANAYVGNQDLFNDFGRRGVERESNSHHILNEGDNLHNEAADEWLKRDVAHMPDPSGGMSYERLIARASTGTDLDGESKNSKSKEPSSTDPIKDGLWAVSQEAVTKLVKLKRVQRENSEVIGKLLPDIAKFSIEEVRADARWMDAALKHKESWSAYMAQRRIVIQLGKSSREIFHDAKDFTRLPEMPLYGEWKGYGRFGIWLTPKGHLVMDGSRLSYGPFSNPSPHGRSFCYQVAKDVYPLTSMQTGFIDRRGWKQID